MVRTIPSVILKEALKFRAERQTLGCTWVYVMHWQDRGPCKVGVAGDPLQRKRELQGGNPYRLKMFDALGFNSADLAFEMERATLARLKHCRLSGEWLDATPIQVRDAVLECVAKRGLRPRQWKEPQKPVDPERARRAMAEYHRLNRE